MKAELNIDTQEIGREVIRALKPIVLQAQFRHRG